DVFINILFQGGRLIVDLELPHDWEIGGISTSTIPLPSGDGITMESKPIEMDWLNQITISHIKYEKWRNGKLIDTELQRFAMRWFGIEEFKLILEDIGFSDITCSADYNYNQQPSN